MMHDGQNLVRNITSVREITVIVQFNASTAFGGQPWYCQDTIDLLVNEGSIDEIVIIGVDNTPDRIDELTYSCPNDNFMHYFPDTTLQSKREGKEIYISILLKRRSFLIFKTTTVSIFHKRIWVFWGPRLVG